MLSERIKKLISYCNLSNKEFSNKIGVQPNALSNYLNNRRSISIEIIINIHKFTKCDLNWLLTGEGEMFLNEKKLDEETAKLSAEVERLKKEISEIESILHSTEILLRENETKNKSLSDEIKAKAERIISLQDRLLKLQEE